ncbi:MAG: hypothetical protein J1F01_00165 [Oscillospiraceae bacterium]|nr:hypothetical protein [Oscillospiraceae bacterium]
MTIRAFIFVIEKVVENICGCIQFVVDQVRVLDVFLDNDIKIDETVGVLAGVLFGI